MATHVRISPDVRTVVDATGAVILDIKRGKYFTLNGTGVEVWTRLEAGLGLGDIVSAIAAARGVDTDRVRLDVDAFVDRLKARHLLTCE